jgi:hypothetical protein
MLLPELYTSVNIPTSKKTRVYGLTTGDYAGAGAPVLKHIPLSMLKELGLIPLMNFPEEVLLIREEYDTALDTFQDWSQKGGGGVVVTGQPGIGECYLDASCTELTNSIRQNRLPLLRPAPPPESRLTHRFSNVRRQVLSLY